MRIYALRTMHRVLYSRVLAVPPLRAVAALVRTCEFTPFAQRIVYSLCPI